MAAQTVFCVCAAGCDVAAAAAAAVRFAKTGAA